MSVHYLVPVGRIQANHVASSWDRTPSKLAITVKPLVIHKDHPDLIQKWEKATKDTEKKLIGILQEHLTKLTMETNDKIRKDTKSTYAKLKSIDKATAKITLEEILKVAEEERKDTQAVKHYTEAFHIFVTTTLSLLFHPETANKPFMRCTLVFTPYFMIITNDIHV